MKKLFAVLALTLTASAFAGENGINFEFERERGINSPNSMENTFKFAPYYKFDNGVKADLQFGASREDGSNQQLENSVEARVQKMWAVGTTGLKLGARFGLGEKFTTSKDFSYYTIEPKAQYGLTDALSLKASWRYRNAFSDSNNYETRTWKVGFGYDVTKKDEVEVKYFQKRGDSNTDGVILEYTRGF